jgi:hypothetical protein
MSEPDRQLMDRQNSAAGVMARLWWMLAGNAVLGFCAVFIFHYRDGWFHTADAVFWITAASLVLVRYLDVRFLNGLTGAGAPATIRHWVRYTGVLILCSVVLWGIAHTARYAQVSGGS